MSISPMYKGVTVCAVLAGGGRGTRFSSSSAVSSSALSSSLPKQFVSLMGKPVIAHAAALLEDSPFVDFAVAVVPPGFEDEWRGIAETYSFGKFAGVAAGGENRGDSVISGIKKLELLADSYELSADDAIVVIHDACRPLAPAECLEEAIRSAYEHGSGVVSVPVTETVKETDSRVRTLDRSRLRIAQTPQVFRLSVLIKAYEAASLEGGYGTDCAFLAEKFTDVKLTEGSYRNIKITHEADIRIAEALMKS